MVRDDQRHPVEPMEMTTQRPDAGGGVQHGLRGDPTKRENDTRAHDFNLTQKERPTRRDFLWRGVTGSQRTMLQHVAEIHVTSRQLYGAENLGQELAGLSGKRFPALRFLGAGRVANAQQVGGRVPFAEHRAVSGRV